MLDLGYFCTTAGTQVNALMGFLPITGLSTPPDSAVKEQFRLSRRASEPGGKEVGLNGIGCKLQRLFYVPLATAGRPDGDVICVYGMLNAVYFVQLPGQSIHSHV